MDGSSSELERVLIDGLRALYREPDVAKCHAGRMGPPPPPGPYRAYRLKPWEPQAHWAVTVADEHVKPGGRVLVVGCGMGRMCLWFAEAGYAVTGIDIVPEFIDAARLAAEAMKSGIRPTFRAVDGFRWPLEGDGFDCVSMMATLVAHLPTASIRARLFSEARRVLRPGGCLLAEAPDRTHPAFRLELAGETSECGVPPLLRELHGLPGVAVLPLHPFRADVAATTHSAWYAADPRELWSEIEAAGMRVVRLQTEQDPADGSPCVTVVATTR